MEAYTVSRTPAFDLLAGEYAREHVRLEDGFRWLIGKSSSRLMTLPTMSARESSFSPRFIHSLDRIAP